MQRVISEINLDALEHNFNIIKNRTKSKIMCVVKANAYGHGVAQIAPFLDKLGADAFAVADIDEGIELRNCGVKKPCLVLGYSDEPEKAVEYDIMPAIFDLNTAQKLSHAAVKCGKTAKIHIALDTGMSRIGFNINNMNDSGEVIEQIKSINKLPGIIIDGIFSHFTTADEEDTRYTDRQFNLFMDFVDRIEASGIKIPTKHISNSAATMMYPNMHLDMVRPGIILYGLAPSEYLNKKNFGFMPVMTLKAKVSRVENLSEGICVGYGNTFVTPHPMRVATVGIGYADGYFRTFSGKACAVYSGHKVKNIGRICMDQCMFDVSSVNNIGVGDYLTLFGTDLTADSLAEVAGTIGYELVCAVGRRVPRIYLQHGKKCSEQNYLLENIVR